MATGDELYWCSKCNRQHEETSGIGKRHVKYGAESAAEVVTAEVVTAESTTDSSVVLTVEDLVAIHSEPQPVCPHCNDTGFVELDNVGLHRKFCVCGQETRDERIGVIPRRPHLGPGGEATDDERAEAHERVSTGHVITGNVFTSSTGDGVGISVGSGSVEVTSEPTESEEPAASEGVPEEDS